jgi:hypothetical protein
MQMLSGSILQQNSNVVFGLAGTVLGAALSMLSAWLLRRREYNLRLWEKLLDKRIKAHEDAIAIALDMRTTECLGGVIATGEVRRTPRVLESKEAFEHWSFQLTNERSLGSTWLAIDVTRELSYLQDYIINLHLKIVDIPSELYPTVGELICDDFIDISASIERLAVRFFKKGLWRLRISDVEQWHKYQKSETLRRLSSTQLAKHSDEIGKLAYIKTPARNRENQPEGQNG